MRPPPAPRIWVVSKEEPGCTMLVAAHGSSSSVLWRNVAVREEEAAAGEAPTSGGGGGAAGEALAATAGGGGGGDDGSDDSDTRPPRRTASARSTPPATPRRTRTSTRTKQLGVPGKLRVRDAGQAPPPRCAMMAELAAPPHSLRAFVQVPIGDPAAPHGALMLAARQPGAFDDAT
jgi:hypothetical protein